MFLENEFSIFFPHKCNGAQIRPCCGKGNLRPSFVQTFDLESPMLYTKIQLKAFLVLEKKFVSILPYMGMAAILVNGAEPFEQIVNILSTEGSS